jgi:hypothetical protein
VHVVATHAIYSRLDFTRVDVKVFTGVLPGFDNLGGERQRYSFESVGVS